MAQDQTMATSGPFNSLDLARLLATDDRRRCFAAIVLGAKSLDDVVAQSGLPVRKVAPAVSALVDTGLVARANTETLTNSVTTVDANSLTLNESVFIEIMRSEVPAAPPSQHDDQPADIAAILDTSIVDGRLVAWPAKRSKRLVVLDWLVQGFEPGLHYKEKVVNRKLGQFTDDTATMRRYLVDEGFLDRADGNYWRSGGSV